MVTRVALPSARVPAMRVGDGRRIRQRVTSSPRAEFVSLYMSPLGIAGGATGEAPARRLCPPWLGGGDRTRSVVNLTAWCGGDNPAFRPSVFTPGRNRVECTGHRSSTLYRGPVPLGIQRGPTDYL